MSDLEQLLSSCLYEINQSESIKRLENVKSAIFGKNGRLTELLKNMRDLSSEEKKVNGTAINAIKDELMKKIHEKFSTLEMIELDKKLKTEFMDVSMPCRSHSFGRIHPLSKTFVEVSNILSSYGLMFVDGNDIESEYYNFTALNIPEHHPARTMHDTFYINSLADEYGRKLLRTHTSPVQIHSMLKYGDGRYFSVGRTYRSDSDATHTPMFNQIEGLIIEKDVGFSHLKWILEDFLKKFFGVTSLVVRFRPSFFPFTQPSAEVDMNYRIGSNGQFIFGEGDNWLEICGCGVVHPNVLKNGNINAEKYHGIAFGFGLERLTSLKYGIPDLRDYFESDDKWRNTFGFHYAEL